MNTLFITTTVVLFCTTMLFVFLFVIKSNKFTKLITEFSKLKKDSDNKSNLIEEIKDQILNNSRKGYYVDKVTLLNRADKDAGKSGDEYRFIVYVDEVERYKGDTSKIKLTKIELISGYDNTQYAHATNSIRNKFSSLKTTSDIEWLEVDVSIKEERKTKLNKILKDEE